MMNFIFKALSILLGGMLVASVVFLCVMLEVEQKRDDQRRVLNDRGD